jgi:4'-phosphopantetheinyl transferase
LASQNAQSSGLWQPAPRKLVLSDDEVHVWRTYLLQTGSMMDRFCDVLAEDEVARSKRFRFDSDRQKFIVARGVLRLILCRYIAAEPSQLRFTYGPYGKPVLLDKGEECSLRFNLSHLADLALYAISDKREVGIDVESLNSNSAPQEIARRFFSSREAGEICGLPPERQREAFFHCWTRKEAYVKARGEGLSFPLDRFEVPLASGTSVTLLREIRELESASIWSLYQVPAARGYSAALVVEGGRCGLRFWECFTGEGL